jgi:hypothetical protein
MKRYLLVALFVSLAPLAARAQQGEAQKVPNSIETIAADMTLAHEGRPHGVPASYGWATKPGVEMGNDPGKFRMLLAWGQLFEDAEGNPATNTRVQIRNIRAYVLGKRDGRWRLLQSSPTVEGAAYREDFVGDVNKPADVRDEPSGGISVTAGGGFNYHFWGLGRKPIDPDDIAGVFTTVEARLVVADPSRPDDRDRARYLLGMGADYWLDEHAVWDEFKTNGGVGIGRFKYVTKAWRSFNMTTLSETELRRNPPPLD